MRMTALIFLALTGSALAAPARHEASIREVCEQSYDKGRIIAEGCIDKPMQQGATTVNPKG